MNKKEIRVVMKELIDKYTYFRNEWIKRNNTSSGFDDWFFNKILKG